MSYAAFDERFAAINDLLNIANLLTWDFRSMMPPGGAETRGKQMATLTGMARDLLLSDDTARRVEAARKAIADLPEDSIEAKCVLQAEQALDYHKRLPADLLRRRAELNLTGQAVWERARAASDFSMLAPVFEEHVDICRRLADAVGYEDHPYDALIAIYEPGATVKSLDKLFAELRAGLSPLLQAVREAEAPRDDFLYRDYPEEGQRAFARRIAEAYGYDFSRGRLDTAPHPYEISQTRQDVRITTRYYRNNIVACLQGTMHEAGHGIYEQQIGPELTRTVLATDLQGLYGVGGISFGVHESQSRLWENQVGRSRGFWQQNHAALQAQFPEALGDIDAETFYRAFSRVRPGLIRVEADELTYDFHIMLRVEFERRLIEGSLKVKDMPGEWNEAMRRDLGMEVPDDKHGVLQDMHWSAGQFGIFCGYTIGNVIAAQLYQAALAQDANIGPSLDRGEYAPLREWLGEKLHRHGRRYERDEILTAITGRPMDSTAYIAYLQGKYTDIYGL